MNALLGNCGGDDFIVEGYMTLSEARKRLASELRAKQEGCHYWLMPQSKVDAYFCHFPPESLVDEMWRLEREESGE